MRLAFTWFSFLLISSSAFCTPSIWKPPSFYRQENISTPGDYIVYVECKSKTRKAIRLHITNDDFYNHKTSTDNVLNVGKFLKNHHISHDCNILFFLSYHPLLVDTGKVKTWNSTKCLSQSNSFTRVFFLENETSIDLLLQMGSKCMIVYNFQFGLDAKIVWMGDINKDGLPDFLLRGYIFNSPNATPLNKDDKNIVKITQNEYFLLSDGLWYPWILLSEND